MRRAVVLWSACNVSDLTRESKMAFLAGALENVESAPAGSRARNSRVSGARYMVVASVRLQGEATPTGSTTEVCLCR